MKQSEKLDLILRGIYERRKDRFIEVHKILPVIGVEAEAEELIRLLGRLHEDGMVRVISSYDVVEITTHGIDYCEEDSYTYRGQPLISNNYNIAINGSSVVQNSQNVTNTINADVKGIISELRTAIESIRAVEPIKSADITDCLNEVESVVNDGKSPKYSFPSLLSIASDLATVAPALYPLVKSLGAAIGVALP
jgi:hypothetical protein